MNNFFNSLQFVRYESKATLRGDEKEFQVPSERKGDITRVSDFSCKPCCGIWEKVPSGGRISGKLAAGIAMTSRCFLLVHCSQTIVRCYRCFIRNWPTHWRNSRVWM
ncbi:hypothetical protein T08_12956 [Trichinella sp. T8]|nr:hypothetical protein T08_12956 [Trichinella sp. T8]